MTTRTRNVRRRLTTLAACSLIATVLPFSALAEQGIPAGSGAVITAGGPLLVRVAPGWDAEVSYEIADGSYVTVWDVAQAAPDGSLWYPVDGGFVPVDSVTSTATVDGGFQLYQDASTEDWTEPAATDSGWVDPNTGEWVDPSASQTGWVDPNTGEWVDPNAAQTGWVDPNTGEWVDPNATQTGWVDPNTGQWVDPAATQTGWVDPNTGEWVDPSATQTGWVDPNTGEWVDSSTVQGWIDPNTGEWVNGVALAQDAAIDDSGAVPATDDLVAEATDAPVDAAPVSTDAVDPNATAPTDAAPDSGGWVDPNTGEWVAAAPADQGAPVTDTWTETAPTDATTDASDQDWVEPAPVDTAATGDSYGDPVGTAYIAGTNGDGVACRASTERGSEKLATLGEGESVEVRGEAVGEWQPVNCAGMGGYVNTSFISWEPAAAPSDSGRRNRNNGGGGGTVNGSEMVQVAMQYVGYPYAYAGEGPYAFDCSGFTKFVAQNALGIDITHDMFTQIGMGQSVNMDQLQPGDLVFFANTFRPGLSHVGIYIGNGQFVHAENESTGVTVSDLNSDYYGSRWAGGTRLA